ncbi:glycosyltransferase family 2 protein [Weissella confusa]|uniref:glycosyltransferase family 2 protein n=1 Tax=Weissella confusa TaxID=1583 RepID=UPI0021A2D43E|nr:glycosyltransferase family 2 protein [Weissella confusa]MCT2911655.1 glycosyltransferase [Weissella confusa]
MSIAVVIVTYNRLGLLKQTIDALEGQTSPVQTIIVVNNNSNDGTKEYLDGLTDSKFIIKHATENLGGAGGFHTALSLFIEQTTADDVWIMDDDTIPTSSALESLLEKQAKIDAPFYSSVVEWQDQRVMNLPKLAKNWAASLQFNVLRTETATFVSMLIPRSVINKAGLPEKDMFIWGDDTEYSLRMSSMFGAGVFDLDSRVLHKTKLFETERSIYTAPENMIGRFFYLYRNDVFVAFKHKGLLFSIAKMLQLHVKAVAVLFKSQTPRAKRASTVIKGAWAGMVFYWRHR